MQVPLESIARAQILEKLASKILKSNRKGFSSDLYFFPQIREGVFA